jgi:hypothetical protein
MPEPPSFKPAFAESVAAVAANFRTDLEHGLTAAEAHARLARTGPNKLTEIALLKKLRKWFVRSCALDVKGATA